IVPIHYEGWKHFREGRAAIEREFERAPAELRRRVRWLPIGDPATVLHERPPPLGMLEGPRER
ncbi:MAG TPA: hypothetical protein VFG79_05090, partial [Solirubrobacter sp.]|nr:hypothetical protein [Solirubrobacter sp.]